MSTSQNQKDHLALLSELESRLNDVKLGGGQKKIDSQHKKGKLTARERITYLLDDDNYLPIGDLAAYGMYESESSSGSSEVGSK